MIAAIINKVLPSVTKVRREIIKEQLRRLDEELKKLHS